MLSSELAFWNRNGYLLIENAVTDEQISAYIDFWNSHHISKDGAVNHYGWEYFTCYMDFPEILDILCSQVPFSYIDELVSDRCGVHLAFTYFRSRERSWHRDVLSEDKTEASRYVTLWIALEDIHPDSGPLAVIPGSHLWDIDHGEAYKTRGYDPLGTLHFVNEIESRNPELKIITPKRGTAILWHGHLVHKVVPASNTELSRKVVIGHLIANEGPEHEPSASLVGHAFGRYHKLQEDKEHTKQTNFLIYKQGNP